MVTQALKRQPHAGSSHPFTRSSARTPVSFGGSSEGVAAEGVNRKASRIALRRKAEGDLVIAATAPNGRWSFVGVPHRAASRVEHGGDVDRGVVYGVLEAGGVEQLEVAPVGRVAFAGGVAGTAAAAAAAAVSGGGPSSVGVQCGRRSGSRAVGKLLPSSSALVVRPRPSWPSPPAPKTYSAPCTVTTIECARPAATPHARVATSLRSLRKLATGVGGWLGPRFGLGSSAGPSGCSSSLFGVGVVSPSP